MLHSEEIEVLWDALLTIGTDKAWRSSLGHVLLRTSNVYVARLTGRYQPWPHGCGTSLEIAVEAAIFESHKDGLGGWWYRFALCPKCLSVLFSEVTG